MQAENPISDHTLSNLAAIADLASFSIEQISELAHLKDVIHNLQRDRLLFDEKGLSAPPGFHYELKPDKDLESDLVETVRSPYKELKDQSELFSKLEQGNENRRKRIKELEKVLDDARSHLHIRYNADDESNPRCGQCNVTMTPAIIAYYLSGNEKTHFIKSGDNKPPPAPTSEPR